MRVGITIGLALVALLSASAVSAQMLPSASIGGSTSAFEQVLGGPNDASIGPQLHYQRCAGTDIDQFIVLAPGDQVWTIQHESCELATPSAEQRFAAAAQFEPSDAVAGSQFTTDLGDTAMTYQSSSLASALPAALFHDCSGNSVPPGTFYVVADNLGGWSMAPGTCPSL
jgi:hypothetical protein